MERDSEPPAAFSEAAVELTMPVVPSHFPSAAPPGGVLRPLMSAERREFRSEIDPAMAIAGLWRIRALLERSRRAAGEMEREVRTLVPPDAALGRMRTAPV